MSVEAMICIFAKPPVAGQVKTRLAAAVGADTAGRLARAFLEDTIESVQALPWAQAALATRVLGLRTRLLEPWFDVDRAEDLERLRTLLEQGMLRDPRTALVLADLRR